ncbi:hypothetical protein IJI31_05065 [bacterium]|nr:hypothetical protein [bacterium]
MSSVGNVSRVQIQPSFRGEEKCELKASLNDFTDTADKIKDKSDQFTKGVDNIKGAITSTAGAVGGIAVSVKGAAEILKPTTDSIKEGIQKPGVQKLLGKIKELGKKGLEAARNNPKTTLIALGITAAAIAAAVIGKTIVKTKAEKAEQQAQAEQAPAHKLDVVSEA